MYKPDTLTRRGSLRSLRSAPLLSTVLESTLSLTRIHPIASLELPGLDYAVHSQSAFGAYGLAHPRDLATCTSLRSGLAAITAASASAAGGVSQSQSALLGRYGPNASIRHGERKIVQPKRVLSRKLKPHLVADTVKQYISRAQRTTKKGSQEQQNMEFLRGVYAFMQVSRSSVSHVKIDSPVFRLHTNATVILLITFSIAVTTRQYVGNPIDCVHTRDIPEDVLNTYCWIHSTYTVVDAFMKKQGSEVPFPGVHNSQGRGPLTIKHTKYYQWVAFTLFFQAILFYTPRWLWKSWEGGKIHALIMDLDIGICSEAEKKQKKKLLLDYLWENLRYHNWWAYRYYVCELLALINVIGQMFLMNRFFDGEFMTFGLEVIDYMETDQEDRMDPMIYIFPRMTKCTFFKYGSSGEVEKHDAICILPLNVVNEKIYIFLWFWFILLTFLTLLTLIYRVVIIFSPRMRVYLFRMRFRLVRRDAIEIIVRRSKMGDWFLLYLLGENIDTVIFRDVVQDLANRLGHNQHHRVPGLKGEIQDA
ncbi:innexin shaking-B isoform X1 [Drosophila suzukii]|uniref:Innexin n=2 Tax=Drosophila suzukii TaxID=28584 RepID=A0ABM4TV98_DROSZ|nr:innexin shaking-B isoform X1 [Drosophila suzukii]XP_036676716.1 innexin shaking-B isoform X1 [Drosophila suzukii]XP_037726113.1 innexin shaking-B isoform X1 [Drosophila subpulchrella]XP_037726115.1 innexin shaking-B isoform X1 [Drosophila subpulchrella]